MPTRVPAHTMSPLIVPAIATLSLGRPEVGHDLHDKIRAAKHVGFPAIEISYFCLEAYASKSGKSLLQAAQGTRALLDELELEAVSLAPFVNFEVCKWISCPEIYTESK